MKTDRCLRSGSEDESFFNRIIVARAESLGHIHCATVVLRLLVEAERITVRNIKKQVEN